jgi:hypothetical protein
MTILLEKQTEPVVPAIAFGLREVAERTGLCSRTVTARMAKQGLQPDIIALLRGRPVPLFVGEDRVAEIVSRIQ